jgi:general secretion pathway protein F
MPVYDYTALDTRGKTVTGIIDADGEIAARQKIRANGQYPVDLHQVKSSDTDTAGARRATLSQLFSRVRASEVALMTRQLATLIGAGFPLVSALDSMITQINSQGLKKIIAGIKGMVVEGSTFAKALGKYPNAFPPIWSNRVNPRVRSKSCWNGWPTSPKSRKRSRPG